MDGQLHIEILGQSFTFETQGDREKAQKAAQFLSEKVQAASRALDGPSTATNKMGIIVLAALDMAHSYLELKESYEGFLDQIGSRSEKLIQRMEHQGPGGED
ncbi:MAG: cell division protein ZapA [Desulfatibacillum sp.]|nr:cell division protein ZapA [Desulfatibacillum sp.]